MDTAQMVALISVIAVIAVLVASFVRSVIVRLKAKNRKAAEDFIDRLAGLRISWYLTLDGWIRTNNFRHDGSPCCPIQAMYAMETGGTEDIYVSAAHFGLSANVRHEIVEAADDGEDGDPVLRQRLLTVLNPTKPALAT